MKKDQNYEKEVQVCKKNFNALCDILSLYELKLQDKYDNKLGNNLIENIIQDFKDPEVTIKFRYNKTIEEVVNYIEIQYATLYRKLKKNKEFINRELNPTEKEKFVEENLRRLVSKLGTKQFDIFDMSNNFINELLKSDILIEKKLELFSELLRECVIEDDRRLYLFKHLYFQMYSKSSDYVKAIKDVVDAFNNGLCHVYNVTLLLEDLLSKEKYDEISNLQELFDFNKVEKTYEQNNSKNEIINVSIVGELFVKTNQLKNIKSIYESDSYMTLSTEIRDNNDIVILNNVYISEILEFIKFKNFNLTEEKINILANRFFEYYKDTNFNRIVLDLYFSEWKNAILEKASNEEEKKEMTEFINQFNNKIQSEIDNYMQLENERRRNELLKRLLSTFKLMSEKAQNEINSRDTKDKQVLERALTLKNFEVNKKSDNQTYN